MECVPCGKKFSGRAPYEQHIVSEKHKRKVIAYTILNNGQTSAASLLNKRNVNDGVTCNACDITFDSAENFQKHALSSEHAEKVLNYNCSLNYNVVSSSELNDDDDSNNHIINDTSNENKCIDPILHEFEENKKPQFYIFSKCVVCDKQFSGPEPYRQHIESAIHLKKISMQNGTFQNAFSCEPCKISSSSELKMNVDDDSNNHIINDTNKENKCIDPILHEFEENKKPQFYTFAKCVVCDKQFSGPEPYRQHIESAIHLKKISMQNGTLQNAFSCEPCKKSFTGQIPYMQHLSSEVHKKKIEDLQFLEKQSPIVTQNALKTDNIFCGICNIHCSGAIPYQQHLSGNTHLKNKAKQQFNNCENSMTRNGSQNGVHLNEKMKADYILPELMNDLEVMSTEEFENSITVFLPDEEIKFD